MIKKILLVVCFIILSHILNCIIPSETVPVVVKMSVSDTVSPYGGVNIWFSSAIEDSIIMMRLFPNDLVLTANLNKTKDTAYFMLPGSVSGNSDYVLIPEFENGMHLNNSLITPDTLHFHTSQREVEPNDNVETADTLISNVFGSISTTDDNDWYKVNTEYVKTIRLRNYGGNLGFKIINGSDTLSIEDSVINTQLFSIPDSVKGAVYVVIDTPLKSAGGYYEVTIQR